MKYVFHLSEPGPKTQVRDHWGLPLNLQVCPGCGAFNHKMATICIKCGQPLSAAKTATAPPVTSADTSADTRAASARAAATGDIQPETPDILKSPPAMAAPSAAIPPQAAPAPAPNTFNPMLASSDISQEQKWLRRAWLAALILVISGAAALLVSSFFQPPPATPYAEKQPSKNVVHSVAAPLLVKPEPAATATQAQTELPDNRLAEAVPVPPERAEPMPIVPPTLEKRALPRTAKGLKKQPAQTGSKPGRINRETAAPAVPTQAPPEKEPTAPTHTPCSEAAQALALCNLN